MVVGRWVTLIFMVLAALWAPQIDKVGSIWKYLQSVLSYTVPPVVAMFLIGTFWKRANAHGAFLSIVVGVLLAVVFFYINEITGIINIHFLYIAPILFVVCSTLLVVGSLMTPLPDEKQVSQLTWSKAFYHSETTELQLLPWYKNYRILSTVLMVITFALVGMFW
jgi:SSS family solute:Na+ symporter